MELRITFKVWHALRNFKRATFFLFWAISIQIYIYAGFKNIMIEKTQNLILKGSTYFWSWKIFFIKNDFLTSSFLLLLVDWLLTIIWPWIPRWNLKFCNIRRFLNVSFKIYFFLRGISIRLVLIKTLSSGCLWAYKIRLKCNR